jgi:Zn-dependent protease with chaperone function
VIPGILFMLAIWPAVRYLFRHAGTGGVLLSIGARDPDPTDLEERQLVNVIEELAIADGIPAPRVMLIDTDVANAAAVGSSPDDATIVVSRALLDDLDRDETQGVLAHLVASIGNGDLRGALSLLAIFQTFGFAAAIVKAPISGPARATVVRVLRYVLIGRHRSHDAAVEARIVSDLLTGGLADTGDDDYSWMDDPANPPRERSGISFDSLRFAPYIAGVIFVGGLFLEAFEIVPVGTKNVLLVLLLVGVLWVTWHQREYAAWRIRRMAAWARTLIMLPYYIAAMLPQVLLSILTSFILEPLIARLWRARRFLADASAVQLTRNPDGLAGGLRALNARGGAMPGGSWAAPLFIIGGTVVDVDPERMRRHLEDLRQKRAAEGRSGDIASLVVDAQSVAALATAEQATQTKPAGFRGFAGSSSSVTNFHPSLGSRLERLRALGANIEYQAARTMPWRRPQATHALGILFMPVVGVLLLIAAVLMVFVVALLLVMSVTACAFMMAIVYGIMSLVLGL